MPKWEKIKGNYVTYSEGKKKLEKKKSVSLFSVSKWANIQILLPKADLKMQIIYIYIHIYIYIYKEERERLVN